MKARVSLGPAEKVNLPIPSGGLSIPGFMIGDVDDVAAQGYQACIKGEVICVPGAINLTATLAGRATPKWLLRRVSGIWGAIRRGSELWRARRVMLTMNVRKQVKGAQL